MPEYGKYPSISFFPQQSAYAIGYPAKPGVPGLDTDQYESIASGFKSVPVSPSLALGSHGYTQRQVTWQTLFSVPPSDCSIILQGALDDMDADYVTVDTSSNAGGETRTVASNLRFFRILADTVDGPCTAIVKIALM